MTQTDPPSVLILCDSGHGVQLETWNRFVTWVSSQHPRTALLLAPSWSLNLHESEEVWTEMCPRSTDTDGAFPLETDPGFCFRLSLSLNQSDGLRPSIINRIIIAPLTLPLLTSLGPEVELYTGYAKWQITR